MNNGWVKLHRKILKSLIFSSEKGLKIWIWCLVKANHKEKAIIDGRKKITIKQGQFMTGKNKYKEELGMAINTVRYWMDFLVKEGLIALKKTNKHTIITILNWKLYQEVAPKLIPNLTPKLIPKLIPNKNVKNVKNVKKSINNKKPSVFVPVKTKSTEEKEIEKQIGEIIKVFKDTVNPLIGYNYKSYRTAAKEIIEHFGFEEAKKLTEFACAIQGKKFAPTITTPSQMKHKIGDLKNFYGRAKDNKRKISNL